MKNDDATKEEVFAFLTEFEERVRIIGIKYVDEKPNNVDTLNVLEISAKDREIMYYHFPQKITVKDQTRMTIPIKMMSGSSANSSKVRKYISSCLSIPYKINQISASLFISKDIKCHIH